MLECKLCDYYRQYANGAQCTFTDFLFPVGAQEKGTEYPCRHTTYGAFLAREAKREAEAAQKEIVARRAEGTSGGEDWRFAYLVGKCRPNSRPAIRSRMKA